MRQTNIAFTILRAQNGIRKKEGISGVDAAYIRDEGPVNVSTGIL